MTITRREAVATLGGAAVPAARGRRPNVVMFMTDDHGAWATGAYGCREMHTPQIDALARGGIRFTRAFAATPVCSPSRMSWITGTLPSTHGVQDWLLPEDSFGATTRDWLRDRLTYSEVLAQNGYTLGMVGKWHMGLDDRAHAGFSYWASMPGGGGPYRDIDFVVNGKPTRITGYREDAIGDFALDFLSRTKERPFYLLMPFYAPHTPYNFQPEEDRQWYRDAQFRCFPDLPVHPWQNKGLRQNHGNRASKLAYSALISSVDRNIGRVLKKLEELHLREDTLVIFTADQGWNAGHHGVWGKGNGTVPFNMYEESIRVPLIFNHPGRIAAGRTAAPMVSSYDYFPTILDYLGVPAPPADPHRPGRSYADFLSGRQPKWPNRLYFEYAHLRGLRTENLKYVERTSNYPSELFDLETDPGETKNVLASPAYREQAARLRSELDAFFQRLGAPSIDQWRTTTKQHLPAESR